MPRTPDRLDPTVEDFLARHGDECAARTLTGLQHLRYQALVLLMALFFCYDWKLFAAALLFACSAFYVGVIGSKLLMVTLSLLFRPEIRVRPDELSQLSDADLPVYTVLVPLYKEKDEALRVLRTMSSLDYPHDKLDVKLLLEEDDPETIAILRAADLPPFVELLVAPQGFPKTKPRACNHGLLTARGEFLVIYDAEDRPDCDQLRKAVAAFRRPWRGRRPVCLQAKLNYFNPDQNLLTRWFTLEYTAWFDLFLPGLHCLGVPIPLGGTSNHFRVDALRELGGWDPFNLTEDADLGLRLHRKGWRTMVLDSTTWEEANSRLGNWIRQRSRWVKGYIQTHFVHMRSNFRSIRQLGPLGWLSALLSIGGHAATLLLNPFFWCIGALWLGLWVGHGAGLTDLEPWRLRYYNRVTDLPGAPLTLWSQLSLAFWVAAVALLTANALFVLINVLACLRRGLWRLLPLALISPLYWVLISIAAWKGFLQLFTRPFYWEKTTHGLAADDPAVCHLPEAAP